jgi:hypothetical protein
VARVVAAGPPSARGRGLRGQDCSPYASARRSVRAVTMMIPGPERRRAQASLKAPRAPRGGRRASESNADHYLQWRGYVLSLFESSRLWRVYPRLDNRDDPAGAAVSRLLGGRSGVVAEERRRGCGRRRLPDESVAEAAGVYSDRNTSAGSAPAARRN